MDQSSFHLYARLLFPFVKANTFVTTTEVAYMETVLGRHSNIFCHLETDQHIVLLNPIAVAFLFLIIPCPLLHISLPLTPFLFYFFSSSSPTPTFLPEHLLAEFLILSLCSSAIFPVITIFGGHLSLSPTLLCNNCSNRLIAVGFLLLA